MTYQQERQKSIKDLYVTGLSAEDIHAALQELADRQTKAIEGSLMRNLKPELEPSPSYASLIARIQRLRDTLGEYIELGILGFILLILYKVFMHIC